MNESNQPLSKLPIRRRDTLCPQETDAKQRQEEGDEKKKQSTLDSFAAG